MDSAESTGEIAKGLVGAIRFLDEDHIITQGKFGKVRLFGSAGMGVGGEEGTGIPGEVGEARAIE